MDRLRPKSWRFDATLLMPPFSAPEDVRVAFRTILDDANARLAIHGLSECSFSYDVPEEGGHAKISGYLHAAAMITEAAVRTWIYDDRIIGDIKWTPVQPGKRGDWKKEGCIQEIFAACDGGSRSLEDWAGHSSDAVNKGGRPKKTPEQPPRPRGRPPRPPPVCTDTDEQAAVRRRLLSMRSDCIAALCASVFPDDLSWRHKGKFPQVELLMTRHAEIARAWREDEDQAAPQPPAAAAPPTSTATPPPPLPPSTLASHALAPAPAPAGAAGDDSREAGAAVLPPPPPAPASPVVAPSHAPVGTVVADARAAGASAMPPLAAGAAASRDPFACMLDSDGEEWPAGPKYQ